MGTQTIGWIAADVPSKPRKAVKRLIKKRLQRVDRLVKKVGRHSDPSQDDIHDLRTETRRADATIRLFETALPRKRSQGLRQQLKRIRHAAGTVRDIDVLLPRLFDLRSCLPDFVVNHLVHRAKAARAKHVSRCIRVCRKATTSQMGSKSLALVKKLDKVEFGQVEVRDLLGIQMNQFQKEFEGEVDALVLGSGRYHQVRIKARRFRYCLESVETLLGNHVAGEAIELLSTLQDSLGEIQDCRGVIQYLEESASACDDDTVAIILREIAGQQSKKLSAEEVPVLEVVVEAVEQLEHDSKTDEPIDPSSVGPL